MSTAKENRKYRKLIIVRRVPGYKNLHQLYTYHFPKAWSAACVANRELIKLAQRQAHSLEHDHSLAGMEWRIRFFKHYFHVVREGGKPEPGLKPYTRFFQYTYVSIYRALQSARDAALQSARDAARQAASNVALPATHATSLQSAHDTTLQPAHSLSAAQNDSSALSPDRVTMEPITTNLSSSARRSPAECQDITFDPITIRPRLRSAHSAAVLSAFERFRPLQANTIRRSAPPHSSLPSPSSLPFREGPGVGFPSPLSPPALQQFYKIVT